MWLSPLDELCILGDVGIRSAATSSDDIDKSFVNVLFYLGSHLDRCLVIPSEAIGQSGVGIT